jgi:uncharacterized protein involved in cysteine biosynthesis
MGSGFFRGFAALFRALPLAFEDRRLLRLTVAPAALALVLTALSAFGVYHYSHLLMGRYQAGEGWLIRTLLWIGLVLAVVAATWLGWLLSSVVATAPFAEALAARSEELAGAAPLPSQKLLASAAQSLRGIGHTLLAVALYVALVVPLFFLQLFVTVLAPVTAVVGLLITAHFLAYDLFDPSLSRRGLSFGEKWRYLGEHRGETLGLGLAAALAAAVPLLGVLVMPLGTVAAARLYVTPPSSGS